MDFTAVKDIVYSDAFGEYVRQLSTQRSALVKSGVVAPDPAIEQACKDAGYAGKLVNLPYWGDLEGEDEVLEDGTALTSAKLVAKQDVAVILRRGKMWGAGDIAKRIAGSDPLGNLAALIVDYWNRRKQTALFSVLKGVFAANVQADKSDLVLDISGLEGAAANINQDAILTAAQKLGDAKQGLTAIAMNSAAETALLKLDGAATGFRPSETPGGLSTWNGKSVIVDDQCGFDSMSGKAELYLFGAGAVALNDCPVEYPLEADRDKKGGVDYVITRQSFICHIRGYAWNGTAVGSSPTNAELEPNSAWTRVYPQKAIRAVKLIAKVG